MRRVVHHPVRGGAGTGDARSATGDARCAKREHGTDAAAGRTMKPDIAQAAAGRHSAVSEANRRPSVSAE